VAHKFGFVEDLSTTPFFLKPSITILATGILKDYQMRAIIYTVADFSKKHKQARLVI